MQWKNLCKTMMYMYHAKIKYKLHTTSNNMNFSQFEPVQAVRDKKERKRYTKKVVGLSINFF